MKYRTCTILTAVIGFALPGAAMAGSFGWFDDAPARDSLGQLRAPLSSTYRETRLTFGVDAYRSFASTRSFADDYDAPLNDSTVVKLYGEIASRPDGYYAPLAVLNPELARQASPLGISSNRLSGFGIKWQHRVDASNTVAFSAGYAEMPWSVSTPHLDALDTRAAVSWRSTWSGAFRPGLTGSVFVGDENVRDEAYQQLGRRYYGFSVGGELQVAQDHTPYFSYRLRRNFYHPDDPGYLVAPYEEYSQISAGWKWQVQRNWSLQAEAHYGLQGAHLDPYSPDRSRVFFGTRFDFR